MAFFCYLKTLMVWPGFLETESEFFFFFFSFFFSIRLQNFPPKLADPSRLFSLPYVDQPSTVSNVYVIRSKEAEKTRRKKRGGLHAAHDDEN